jgi:glycosyltransferase involved in cell wall biosynthesis
LNPSLSVVVPVSNVEATLVGTVEQLLEILPEMTDRFEVVLVDDASTDATAEAARELSLGYPQVQLIAQTAPLGAAESLRNALRFAQGEMLMYCTGRPRFDLHDIRKLWDRRTDGGGVWALADGDERLMAKFPTPAVAADGLGGSLPDLLLVPRRLLAGWQSRRDTNDVVGALRSRGYAMERVELRGPREIAQPPRPKSDAFARSGQGKSWRNLISSGRRR